MLRRDWLFLISTCAFSVAASTASAGTAAHAMVVAGQAQGGGGFACATSGPQARESAFFNSGIGLPTEGYASCSLAGGINNKTSVTGPVLAHQDVTASFNGGTAVVSADAKADYGVLGVRSLGTYSGSQDAFTYKSAEGAAYFSDSLTFAGTGVYNVFFGWDVDGSALTSVGASQTQTFLNYQINSGPIFSAFVANSGGGGPDRAISPVLGGGTLAGFTIAPRSVNGSGTAYSFLTPITLGTAFDFSVGIFASSIPTAFGGIANNEWFSTARLSSIQAFDSSGNRVAFAITSASGTVYDANGAHPRVVVGPAVPEPATWLSMICGFGLLGVSLRRRRAKDRTALAV